MSQSLFIPLRENVKPLFYTRMRLGEFDPPDMVPYNKINTSVIQSPEHQELAIKTAMRTFVLMKNKGNILPLKQKFKTLGVSNALVTFLLGYKVKSEFIAEHKKVLQRETARGVPPAGITCPSISYPGKRGYLPWRGAGGTHLAWGWVPTLDWGCIYLGQGVPTLGYPPS